MRELRRVPIHSFLHFGIVSGGILQGASGHGALNFNSLSNGQMLFRIESLISMPLWLGASGMLAGTYAYHSRLRNLRQQALRHELQERIRHEFANEPLDFWLEKAPKPQSRRLCARWYGGHNQAANSANAWSLIDRFEFVTTTAQTYGVDEITIDTAWVRALLINSPDENAAPAANRSALLRNFGTLGYGRETLLGNKVVVDLLASEEALTMSTDKALRLVETLRECTGGTLLNELVSRIEADHYRSRVATAYAQYQASHLDEDRNILLRTLQHEMGEIINDDSRLFATVAKPERTDGTYHRSQASTTTTIVGMNVRSFRIERDPSSGRERMSVAQIDSLYRVLGVHDLADLERKLNAEEFNSRSGLAARVALYSHLLREHEVRLGITQQTESHAGITRTLYQRMKDEPPRTFPTLSRLRRTESEATVAYHHKHGRIRRNLAGSIVLLFAGVTYPAAGDVLHIATDSLVSSSSKRYEREHPNTIDGSDEATAKRKKYAYRLYESEATTRLLDISLALQQFGDEMHNTAEKAWGNRLQDSLKQFFRLDLGEGNIKFPKRNYLNSYVPRNAFGDMRFGDVNLSEEDSKLPIFAITPLGARRAAGYWYTDTFESVTEVLGFDGGTPPLADDTEIVAESTHWNVRFPLQRVAIPVEPPQKDQILFKVTTPYVADPGEKQLNYLRLPYLSGTRIAAARLVESDENSPHYGKVIGIYLAKFPDDDRGVGTNRGLSNIVADTQSPITISEYSKPQLEYWLAADSNIVPKATTPFRLHSKGFHPISERIKSSTRNALGLPKNATDQQIFAAVSNKKYSFTPYADDEYRAEKMVAPLTLDEKVEAVATAMAELKYANCNTSALTLLAATGGSFDGLPINQAGGYLTNDNTLRLGQSHTWLFDQRGRIIDGTARGLAISQDSSVPDKINVNTFGSTALTFGLGLLSLGLGAAGYRNRKRLGDVVRTAKRAPYAHQLAHNSWRDHRGLDVLLHHTYAKPGTAFDPKMYRDRQPLADRIATLQFAEPAEIAGALRTDDRYAQRDRDAAIALLDNFGKLTDAHQAMTR